MVEPVKEKYSGAISVVEIGNGPNAVRIGGETTMPFMIDEGDIPYRPQIAYEIQDCDPVEWPDGLKAQFEGTVKDPAAWAKFCVKELGARVLALRLYGCHPDSLKRSPDEAADIASKVLSSAGVPMIILGCGDDDRDNEVLPKVSQAVKGQNCLLGIASQNNYKTLTATAVADGHSIIAESPIDINIAKQLNILISDMGFKQDRIVMHPSTASLGYGMEYVYSIMERARLAAFIGDRMLSMPLVLFPGQEVWKTKEAKESNPPQGAYWELATAMSMLAGGADMLVMRHPKAAGAASNFIDEMMNSKGVKR